MVGPVKIRCPEDAYTSDHRKYLTKGRVYTGAHRSMGRFELTDDLGRTISIFCLGCKHTGYAAWEVLDSCSEYV